MDLSAIDTTQFLTLAGGGLIAFGVLRRVPARKWLKAASRALAGGTNATPVPPQIHHAPAGELFISGDQPGQTEVVVTIDRGCCTPDAFDALITSALDAIGATPPPYPINPPKPDASPEA